MRYILAVPYRRFGTTYRSRLQWSRKPIFKGQEIHFLIIEDGTDRLSRNIGKVLPTYAT